MTEKISVIGCGNIGQSIINGMIYKNLSVDNIIATRRNTHFLDKYKQHAINITDDNIFAVKNSKTIILAVKPLDIVSILENIKDSLIEGHHVIISLATGLTTDEIEKKIETNIPIFRAIPNTASEVGESVTCICYKNADNNSIKTVENIFNKIGISLIISEEHMEAATILGACGIAYVLRYIRAMIQGGIQVGLDSNTAKQIVNHTVRGAAELLVKKNSHPEEEIDKVTTPKGCTIVGLNEMEHRGFSSSLIKGIVASYEKIEK